MSKNLIFNVKMECQSCETAIKNALLKKGFISKTNLAHQQVRVEANEEQALEIRNVLKRTGKLIESE